MFSSKVMNVIVLCKTSSYDKIDVRQFKKDYKHLYCRQLNSPLVNGVKFNPHGIYMTVFEYENDDLTPLSEWLAASEIERK